MLLSVKARNKVRALPFGMQQLWGWVFPVPVRSTEFTLAPTTPTQETQEEGRQGCGFWPAVGLQGL